jgi:hypothetical protein
MPASASPGILPPMSPARAHLAPLPIPSLDAEDLPHSLDSAGFAVLPGLVSPEECARLAGLYDDTSRFRSRVVMARHGFGRGEYQYFANPLPPMVAALRRALYPLLAPVANGWMETQGRPDRYPDSLPEFLARCHAGGQSLPTPLLLRYGRGDFNCLHQDLYGPLVFPLQTTVLLSRPGTDFTGGEFVLTHQRPRMQSRADVVPLGQGDAVVFAVNERPVQGTRRMSRQRVRHGVSEVRSGQRYTLGIIFHDAAG